MEIKVPITRRSAVIGAALVAGCSTTKASNADPRAFVRRAMQIAGGESALRAARVLAWAGAGVVHAAGNRIEIGVDTIVEPFAYARSTTWLLSQGRAATERTLEIDGTRGFAIRSGVREALPEALVTHERQQYALYGLMLLAPLLAPETSLRFDSSLAGPPGTHTALHVRHPIAAETTFFFNSGTRLVGARNTVTNPESGGAAIAQDIVFTGTIAGGGITWPRSLSIRQNGAAYFDLTLETFEPRGRR